VTGWPSSTRAKSQPSNRPENLKTRFKKLKSIEVSFDRSVNTQSLSEISHIKELKKEGDKFIVYTDNVNGLIHSLTDFAGLNGLKIVTLNTRDPSLEEVFVELTGEA
jgi:ABC-2 type transport system ATP-binding protein